MARATITVKITLEEALQRVLDDETHLAIICLTRFLDRFSADQLQGLRRELDRRGVEP